ncbi:MAG: CHASE2 domain-containing protein, partial [Giesbergeria sp.]
MRATASDLWRACAAALAALLLVWAAAHSRPWHALEFRSFDLWTSLAAPGQGTVPVAILAIDEPSFQQLGHGWPFPRSLHTRLMDRLREDGARAVGFDVVFAD